MPTLDSDVYVTRRCALLSICRRSPFLRVLEIREPSKVEDTSTVLVRALVERATVAEAIKASFGYEVCVHPRGLSFGEESIAKLRARELRFRVRASSPQGYSSPSEPSETLALQMEGQASKATPPLPTFLGRGFLLMEDGALHEP